jgi:2-dehydro-3-deoxyphosphooctonate aldolase (KDO 8-P synthase)
MGRKLKTICADIGAQFVFKASYDKANRTSVSSFRGTNVRDGCQLLAEIGIELGVPVTTDVHSPQEVEVASQFIDLIQIPAFLCRQTDLILAAGASVRAVNVKKGQFLAPWDVKNIAVKLQSRLPCVFSPNAEPLSVTIISWPICSDLLTQLKFRLSSTRPIRQRPGVQ